jgi:hypothetical protein
VVDLTNVAFDYWLLTRAKPAEMDTSTITTCAFVVCTACGKTLVGRGGPRKAICAACLDRIENIQADMRERY